MRTSTVSPLKPRHTARAWLAILGLACSVPASAAWKIDAKALSIPAPPQAGSAADREDFEILLRYQEARTEAECKAAERQAYGSMKVLFGPQLGVLTADEFDSAEELGNRLIQAVSRATEPFKSKWLRKRPYDRNPEISPCIRKPGGNKSYPSGHAASGYVVGEALARAYPAKKEALLALGLQVGENRLIGGVHHPSDVEASHELGRQILGQLLENEEFVAELRSLRH